MINKKMIPGIIIFVILIVIIIVIICNYNKKNKENKNNSDKLRQCQQQCSSKLQQSNQNAQQCNQQLQQHKPQLKDNQLTISNLEKEIKANKFKLDKARYHSGEFQRTKLITLQLLESLAPDLKVGLGKGYTGKPLLGGVQETLDQYIADQKGDKKAAKAAENKTKMTEMTIGLLKALYEAFNDNFDEQSCLNLLKTVGLDALNIALACADLGWLCGPINALVKNLSGNTKSPNLDIAKALYDSLQSANANAQINNNIGAIQSKLQQIAGFLQGTYPSAKHSVEALCPSTNSPYPYCVKDSQTATSCDFAQANTNLQQCFKNATGINSINQYDPSIVQPYSGDVKTKRAYLTNILSSSDSPFFNMINGGMTGTIPQNSSSPAYVILDSLLSQTSTSNGFTAQQQLSFMVNGYPLYIYIIIYTISYYQELALIDDTTDGNPGPYKNPYTSGNINTMLGNTTYSLSSNLYNTSGNGGLWAYIINTFKCYYNQLTFKDNTLCCGDKPTWADDACCCGSNPNYNSQYCNTKCGCDKWKTIEDGFAMLNTVDPKSKRNWYQLMAEKYNDNYYSASVIVSIQQNDNSDQKQSSPGDAQSVMTKYLAYFNEYLNFPFDTCLNFAKMAGYTPLTTLDGGKTYKTSTSSDLFTYMLTKLYADKRVPITKPLPKISIIFPNQQDPSKGYPFGLDKPSYADAYSAVTNFNTTPTLEDIDYYNTYGTPAYSIEPGASFDASMFNFPGDVKYGSYSTGSWICEDGLADNIRSALLPGAIPGFPGATPGKTDSATPNSRQTYCISTKTGKLSNLIPYNPNQNYGPLNPPAEYKYSGYNIVANNELYILKSDGRHWNMNDQQVIGWQQFEFTVDFSFTDAGNIKDVSLIFDSAGNITDGNISLRQTSTTPGPSTTPGAYVPPIGTARPWSTTPGPTTTYSPSKSGSITNAPIVVYYANMPTPPLGVLFNKNWLFTISGSSYTLSLNSKGVYSLNGSPLQNFQTWGLTIISQPEGLVAIFGEKESLIYYSIGNNLSYNPVSYVIPEPLTIPPSGFIKNWKLTFANYHNGSVTANLILDDSGRLFYNGVLADDAAYYDNILYISSQNSNFTFNTDEYITSAFPLLNPSFLPVIFTLINNNPTPTTSPPIPTGDVLPSAPSSGYKVWSFPNMNYTMAYSSTNQYYSYGQLLDSSYITTNDNVVTFSYQAAGNAIQTYTFKFGVGEQILSSTNSLNYDTVQMGSANYVLKTTPY